ncbi:TPA: DUF58 domain-containing protein [Candidatus Poribacteria bacterium]|nr:DUF58 domain-containing protein [Candidatus Poribacteria bacterium]
MKANRTETLIEPDLMKMLEKLSIATKKLFPGAMKGKRRSIKRGSSVEFADYRDYQLGDDFRFIDWNIYARLDKLFLKTFVEEENIYIHILLDVSSSMNFGTPSKLEYAKKIAVAFGYIGLVDLDMVVLTTFSETLNGLRPLRGKDQIFKILNFLNNFPISDEKRKSLIDECLKKYAIKTPYRGVAIVISDFLVAQNVYENGLKALLDKGFDVKVIQVLSNDEIDPNLTGELRLQDAETDETKEVTITDRLLERYKRRLDAFCSNLKNFCDKNNIAYVKVSTDYPYKDFILKETRRQRILL